MSHLVVFILSIFSWMIIVGIKQDDGSCHSKLICK